MTITGTSFTGTSFQTLVDTAFAAYAETLNNQLWNNLYTTYTTTPTTKESKVKNTADLIAEKRAEITKEEIEKALKTFTGQFKMADIEPGDTVTYSAKFPDNDTLYRYAAIMGSDNRWYTTAASRSGHTTTQFIDELVRLFVEADHFEWQLSWAVDDAEA